MQIRDIELVADEVHAYDGVVESSIEACYRLILDLSREKELGLILEAQTDHEAQASEFSIPGHIRFGQREVPGPLVRLTRVTSSRTLIGITASQTMPLFPLIGLKLSNEELQPLLKDWRMRSFNAAQAIAVAILAEFDHVEIRRMDRS